MRRKTTTSSKALVERARALGVHVPEYSMPSAQADVDVSRNVREAAAKILNRLVEEQQAGMAPRSGGTGPGGAGGARPTQARHSGSGRSKSDPKILRLHI